jgi:hypothetical protein
MTVSRSVLLPFVALCLPLFACKLLKPSPKKLCEKAEKLMRKGDAPAPVSEGEGEGEKSATMQAKCLTELSKMKSDEPARYECTSKCINGAEDGTALGTCMGECKKDGVASTGGGDDDSTKTYPVDSLTPASIRSKIESEYQHYGQDITGETTNSVGWSATVMLGKKGSYGEAHIYKVILVDVNGRTDGYAVAERLKKSGASETRTGNKKLLVVNCMFQRSSSEAGMPKECGGYDSKIRSFTDDLATY